MQHSMTCGSETRTTAASAICQNQENHQHQLDLRKEHGRSVGGPLVWDGSHDLKSISRLTEHIVFSGLGHSRGPGNVSQTKRVQVSQEDVANSLEVIHLLVQVAAFVQLKKQ